MAKLHGLLHANLSGVACNLPITCTCSTLNWKVQHSWRSHKGPIAEKLKVAATRLCKYFVHCSKTQIRPSICTRGLGQCPLFCTIRKLLETALFAQFLGCRRHHFEILNSDENKYSKQSGSLYISGLSASGSRTQTLLKRPWHAYWLQDHLQVLHLHTF